MIGNDRDIYIYIFFFYYKGIKYFLLINVKMPSVVGILTFMSRKNSILSSSEPESRAA